MISAVREDAQEHFDPRADDAHVRSVMRTALVSSALDEVSRASHAARAWLRTSVRSVTDAGARRGGIAQERCIRPAASAAAYRSALEPAQQAAESSDAGFRSPCSHTGEHQTEALSPWAPEPRRRLEPARTANAIRFCNERTRAACDHPPLCLGCSARSETWETS